MPSGLDTAGMQAIAHEFNHPETVFVFAPGDAAHRARIRIFTPRRELPFAGHPDRRNSGSARPARRRRRGPRDRAGGGDRPGDCTFEASANAGGRARFTIPQLPAEVGPVPDDAVIAAALGLAPDEIGDPRSGALVGRGSRSHSCTSHLVPRSSAAIPIPPASIGAFGTGGAAYVVCRQTVEPGHSFHARMFAPGLGIPEDPATGSAAAAFAGLLASQLARRDAPPHHRAGLRDGTAEPDPARGGGRGRTAASRLRSAATPSS